MADFSYRSLRVLITGHTGFKGSWLTQWLLMQGAQVCGYALPPNTKPALFNVLDLAPQLTRHELGDILDYPRLQAVFKAFEPDIVFHLAAQPLVRLSYTQPVQTYAVNVMGTLNVLEAARQTPSVRAVVNVTTDKCYENTETHRAYRETDPLGGYDMYSSSKACSEILSASYRRSFLQNSFALATARAGNVIGGGDWAQDRLLPDCMRALAAGAPIVLRSPHALRPWQFVLEPLGGYLLLGEKLLTQGQKFAQAFNFGPDNRHPLTVEEMARLAVACYGSGSVKIQPDNGPHEAALLTLDSTKAHEQLGWRPVYLAAAAVRETVAWYKQFYTAGKEVKNFTARQIQQFQECLPWKKN